MWFQCFIGEKSLLSGFALALIVPSFASLYTFGSGASNFSLKFIDTRQYLCGSILVFVRLLIVKQTRLFYLPFFFSFSSNDLKWAMNIHGRRKPYFQFQFECYGRRRSMKSMQRKICIERLALFGCWLFWILLFGWIDMGDLNRRQQQWHFMCAYVHNVVHPS